MEEFSDFAQQDQGRLRLGEEGLHIALHLCGVLGFGKCQVVAGMNEDAALRQLRGDGSHGGFAGDVAEGQIAEQKVGRIAGRDRDSIFAAVADDARIPCLAKDGCQRIRDRTLVVDDHNAERALGCVGFHTR